MLGSVETSARAPARGGSPRTTAIIGRRKRPAGQTRASEEGELELDNLVGWIVMTLAVLPALITLLLAWTGPKLRKRSSDFIREKPQRPGAAPQAGPQNKKRVLE
jgi:hypothetical protein